MEKEIKEDPMLTAYLSGLGEQEVEASEEETEIETEETEVEKPVIEEEKEILTPAAEIVKEETKEEVKEEAKPFLPEFKSEKSRWMYETLTKEEGDKEVYEALRKKFEPQSYTDEQKAFAFLKEKHPYLDEDDLAFKAASEFGIGVTRLDEDDLTEDDKRALKAQEIKRKELISQADAHFKQQTDSYELPTLPNPLDLDEDYKSYKEFVSAQEKEQEAFKAEQEKVFTEIDTTSLTLEKIEIEPKITLDEREFTFKSEFKLDENKRKQLAEYAKEHIPTQGEVAQFQSEDGKFNMQGYLSHLATIKFQKQIINAAVKEGIAQAREEFVEKDLKNSTLRNNQTMQQTNREVSPEVAAMRA